MTKKQTLPKEQKNNSENSKIESIKKFLKTKKGVCLLLVTILIIVAVISIVTWNILFVKVKFDTAGGTEIKQVYIRKGTKLDKIATPNKIGSNFISWTYKEDQSLYDSNHTIKEDIELLANYEAMPEEGFVEESFKNISTNAKLVVHSLEELNNQNINKYLKITNDVGNQIALNVKKDKEDKYTIEAKDGWYSGFTYIIENQELTKLEFISIGNNKIGKNTSKINFLVKTKNKTEYEYKDNARKLSTSVFKNIKSKGTTIVNGTEVETFTASVENSQDYQMGDVLLLGADTEDLNDDHYYVVTNSLAGNQLEVRNATLTDVYEDLLISYSEEIEFSESEADLVAIETAIRDDIYENIDPFIRLSNAYVEGAFETPQVKTLLSDMSETEIIKLKNETTIKTPLKDVIIVDIDPTNGYDEDTGKGSVKITVGVRGLNVDIGTKASLTLDFTITEVFDLTLNVTVAEAENEGTYSYVSVRVDNNFSVGFTITLKTDTGIEDISSEIEKYIDNPNDKYAWVEEINNSNIMETTFDYIPILEKSIFEKMVWIFPISIKIDIDAIVRVGAEASFTANYSISSYATAGTVNGYAKKDGKNYKFYTYDTKEVKDWSYSGSNGQKISLTLKGAVGIRAGIKVGLSLSALGMNDAYSIGVAFEAGVYMKLSGFVRLEIDVSNSQKKSDIDGGIVFETGIYFSVYFTWNCWPFGMNSVDDILLVDAEFPLYKFSSLGETLGFVNAQKYTEDNPLIITSKEYNIFKESPYIGNFAVISFNSKTNEYEAIEKEPESFNMAYYCREYYDKEKNQVYCNPNKDINKNIKYYNTGDKKGTIEILDGAKDGDKFYLRLYGSINNPVTGLRTDYLYQDVWFQYSAPKDDGVYKITFDAGDGYFLTNEEDENGNQIRDEGPSKMEFEVKHGEILIFKKIPQSYTKDGKTYVFDKWSNDFNEEGYFLNGDETVKAIYKESTAEYTYSFFAAFGKFKNGTDTLTLTSKHGEKFGTVDTPTRTNYTFVGWTTDPLGDDVTVTVKDGYLYDLNGNIIYGNTEVFAIWKEKTDVNKYTLTFDAGDGWLVDDNGNFSHSVSYTTKKGEEFYDIPIAIKSPNDAPDYYYTDETFGLESGFIPKESKTYTANYKKVNRNFDVFISDSTFIKQNGKITYSDDIIANTTDDKWLTGTFTKKLSLPSASVEVNGKTYTTNKYILIVENKKQKPYSIKSGASNLKSKYNWSYNTLNVTMYGNNTTSIVYDPSSTINYGTLISYFYATTGLDLKGISYVECTAIPYFEIS